MKKFLVALSILAVTAAAYAQSSVQVYGVADAYVASGNGQGAAKVNAINSGGLEASRIGFKGQEDLGSGLKAIFALEYGLNLDANDGIGAGNNAARQQYVGLATKYGTVVAGRLQTTAYDWQTKFDPLGTSSISALGNLQRYGNFNVSSVTGDARANNAIAYVSPTVANFSGAVNYSRAVEQTAGTQINDSISATLVGLNYEKGPFAAGVVYDRHTGNQPSLNINDTVDIAVGASYDFTVAKLYTTFQTHKNKNAIGQLGETDKVYSVGAAVPVTKNGRVLAQYAKSNISSVDNADATGYTLAYVHDLSKRTALYGGYSQVKNDTGTTTASNGFNNTTELGGSTKAVFAGMRHSF